MFIGILILALGVIFLLQNLGYIQGSLWQVIWPLALMALGISILLEKWRERR